MESYSLCPYCYNNPLFEGIHALIGGLSMEKENKSGGMPCSLCPHPAFQHSMIKEGVCSCPECNGTLLLDPTSAPKWRLECNKCNWLVSIP